MFLYYSTTAPALEEIRRSLFWDLPENALSIVQVNGTGPDGKQGYFMAAPGLHRVHGVNLQEQTWVDCGTHWLGWDKQALPKPEQLQRKKIVAGRDATLNDGNLWHCPTIRKVEGGAISCGLPRVIQRFGDSVTSTVKPMYANVWGVAAAAWDSFAAGGTTVGQFIDYSCCFLGVNYRISHNEASALQLLDEDSMTEIVSVALDVEAITEMVSGLKKKD